MRKLATLLLFAVAIMHCRAKPPEDRRQVLVNAAKSLTARCAATGLRVWKVNAQAAGADCRVLYIHASVVLEDAMIEALHYGADAYSELGRGGIEKFSTDQAFRGVAYKDASGRIWIYGNVTQDEAEEPTPCH